MNTIKIKRVPVSVITKFKLWRQGKPSTRVRLQVSAKVGLFYSTSTGNTEAAAEWIQEKFAKHGDIAAPVDICEANVSDMQAFDSLIVGAPTWNTGADEGRSGTAWDDVLDELGALNLKGKKVTLTYGRIGIKNPAQIVKKFKGKSASEDAKKFAASKIREKLNKGYLEI